MKRLIIFLLFINLVFSTPTSLIGIAVNSETNECGYAILRGSKSASLKENFMFIPPSSYGEGNIFIFNTSYGICESTDFENFTISGAKKCCEEFGFNYIGNVNFSSENSSLNKNAYLIIFLLIALCGFFIFLIIRFKN